MIQKIPTKYDFMEKYFTKSFMMNQILYFDLQNMSVQYTAIFHCCKNDNFQMKIFDIFLIFDRNIDCGYTLEAVLTSTQNLCFRAKKKKIMYTPVNPSFTI